MLIKIDRMGHEALPGDVTADDGGRRESMAEQGGVTWADVPGVGGVEPREWALALLEVETMSLANASAPKLLDEEVLEE